MPTNSELYGAQGPGTDLLPNPLLTFLTTSDPVLGSSSSEVPDGPFNRELHKLLKNDSALANVFKSYLSRTYAVLNQSAPNVGVVPGVVSGAPSSPTNFANHVVAYTNFEVLYVYNSVNGGWSELSRSARSGTSLMVKRKTVLVPLSSGSNSVTIDLPTVDDNNQAFEFLETDIKTFYIYNVGESNDLINVNNCVKFEDSSLSFVLSADVPESDAYQLVCIFERVF